MDEKRNKILGNNGGRVALFRKMKVEIIALFCLVFLIGLASASMNVQLSDQGTGVINSEGVLQSGDLTVLVYEVATGGSPIYNETFVGAIYNGSWNVMLGANAPTINLTLIFDKIYYRDYLILGEDASFDGVDRQVFYSPLGEITEEDFGEGINLSLGQRITFALGEMIDNIVDGWIRITGGLNVTENVNVGENVTAKYFIGDGSQLTGVSGSGSGSSYYYNKTGTLHTAGLSAGGYVGYKAGNYICNQEFAGTHLCYESEVILTIDNNNVSTLSQWSGNAWIIAGGAKYSPASLPVNDCNGFTHGVAGNYLGSFWMFDQTDGGAGGIGHCANSLPLACCKTGGYA
jgi:hypothetical protein